MDDDFMHVYIHGLELDKDDESCLSTLFSPILTIYPEKKHSRCQPFLPLS